MSENSTSRVPETLEELILWSVEHDTRVDIWWDQQHTWNQRLDTEFANFKEYSYRKFREMQHELDLVKRRLVWWAGAAAGIAATISVLGTLLGTRLFERIFN
jgi:hypothetical protein